MPSKTDVALWCFRWMGGWIGWIGQMSERGKFRAQSAKCKKRNNTQQEKKSTFIVTGGVPEYLCGSHALSAGRVWRTKPRCPKGLHLEARTRRAPRLPVMKYLGENSFCCKSARPRGCWRWWHLWWGVKCPGRAVCARSSLSSSSSSSCSSSSCCCSSSSSNLACCTARAEAALPSLADRPHRYIVFVSYTPKLPHQIQSIYFFCQIYSVNCLLQHIKWLDSSLIDRNR